jgi:hypothetical protein
MEMKILIKEEFQWSDVSEYLEINLNVAFVGPGYDERSKFFPDVFSRWKSILIYLEASQDTKSVQIKVFENGNRITYDNTVELLSGIRGLLNNIRSEMRIACIDLSSLQHCVLMYLTKLLIEEIKPIQLFATYAEPVEYSQSQFGEFMLSEELLGRRSVPGFARRIKENPTKLLTMLGFDGERLNKITEDLQTSSVTPVIGFPSFRPGWHNRSLKSSMRAIEDHHATSDIHKCNAKSIFDAYELIHDLRPRGGETYALAPLGTRPHSMACAIYATRYPGTLIIYDHPVEVTPRSIGISSCTCYHLSSFIQS